METVENGAQLLDGVRPGWASEIELEWLDMSDCDLCVLGQLWGTYMDGLDVLEKPSIGDQQRFGFDKSMEDGLDVYRQLNEAWEKEILCRL